MSELIEALLSLAQVSRTSLRSESVNLSALAQELLLYFQEREPHRTRQLKVESGLLAQGDPRLLRHVLESLLGNAWKFTANEGRTEISVGHCKGSAGETVYFVRDNGVGFDMAYVDQLFGAFQRLHCHTEFTGNGIGLATVQRIVEKYSGRVWAESVLGEGTLGTPMS